MSPNHISIPLIGVFKVIIWGTVAAALYSGLTVGFAHAFHHIAFHFNQGEAVKILSATLGAVIGMVIGLTLNFGMAPFLLKRMLYTRPVEDDEVITIIQKSFSRARIPLPDILVMDFGKAKIATAIIAGFKNGKGPFRPALFISRPLLEALHPLEIEAVILHEVSHINLNHAWKRLSHSIAFIVIALLSTSLLLGAVIVLTGSVSSAQMIVPIVAFAACLATLRFLNRLSRRLESEADFFTIEKLGANLNALVSALRKLDQINDPTPRNHPIAKFTGSTHPATEERIRSLLERFDKPASDHQGQPGKAA